MQLGFAFALAALACAPAVGRDPWSVKLTQDARIVHALRRLTFGPRPGDVEKVRRMGLNKWLDLQLHPERIPQNPVLEQKLKPLETLRLSPAEMVEAYPPQPVLKAIADARAPYPTDPAKRSVVERALRSSVPPQRVVAQELMEAKILRAVLSNRQLEETLVDFWYNHFNVYLDKGADHYLVTAYERDAIRPYVLGKFKDMLLATARSPAMLFYLDNWQSVAPGTRGRRGSRGLNENYGRELLELHTLGVDGGYTQKDVIEVARCFTGWTIQAPRQGGEFRFDSRVHDAGEKTVLGVRIPAGGGISDGEKVIDLLARHPSTARFISRSLAIRFVADNPPPRLVERMAETFLKTGGDLRAVMKTMLRSKEFFSEAAYTAKIKSPLETAASAVRALDAQVDSAGGLARAVAQLGEPLYRRQEPTGYANTNADWVNSASLVARMNFAVALVSNRVPGVRVDPDIDVARLPVELSGETRAAAGEVRTGRQYGGRTRARIAGFPASVGGSFHESKDISSEFRTRDDRHRGGAAMAAAGCGGGTAGAPRKGPRCGVSAGSGRRTEYRGSVWRSCLLCDAAGHFGSGAIESSGAGCGHDRSGRFLRPASGARSAEGHL